MHHGTMKGSFNPPEGVPIDEFIKETKKIIEEHKGSRKKEGI